MSDRESYPPPPSDPYRGVGGPARGHEGYGTPPPPPGRSDDWTGSGSSATGAHDPYSDSSGGYGSSSADARGFDPHDGRAEPAYGAPAYADQAYPAPAGYGYGGDPDGGAGRRPGKGPAIAALVLGVLSVLTFLLPILPVLLAIAAIVCAVLALRRTRRAGGKGLALGGLVTGIIGLVVGGLMTLLWGVLGAAVGPMLPQFGECAQLPDQTRQQECIDRVLRDNGMGPGPTIDPAVENEREDAV